MSTRSRVPPPRSLARPAEQYQRLPWHSNGVSRNWANQVAALVDLSACRGFRRTDARAARHRSGREPRQRHTHRRHGGAVRRRTGPEYHEFAFAGTSCSVQLIAGMQADAAAA